VELGGGGAPLGGEVAPLLVHLWPGGCGYVSYDPSWVQLVFVGLAKLLAPPLGLTRGAYASYDPSWVRLVFV